jgi:hypothetical protein
MAGIKKKEGGGGFKDKFSTKTKYKETSYYFCGDAFLSASGLPGPVMGGINMFLGHSNSSKTTAMILAAADAQKKGHLPVFIITEKKWSWEHAVELGLDAKKNSDGEWDGDFIFNDSFVRCNLFLRPSLFLGFSCFSVALNSHLILLFTSDSKFLGDVF